MQKIKFTEPYLKNLKEIIKTYLNDIQISINSKNNEEYNKTCEKIYKKIRENLKSELVDRMEEITKIDLYNKDKEEESDNKSELNSISSYSRPSQYNFIRRKYLDFMNEKDKSFGQLFTHTQLFINYFEDLRELRNKCII